MTLTVSQVRDHVEADHLDDTALGRIITGEEARIDKECGKASNITEVKDASGLEVLFLNRPASAIVSIKERRSKDGTQVTLAADDYRALSDRSYLRLQGGSNGQSHWGSEVTVVYTPATNADLRNLALIELVRITVEQRAAKMIKDGDYTATYENPLEARRQVLDGLQDTLGIA